MAFLMIFWGFPTTFRRFPKIFQNCSEGQMKMFPDIFREFPKIPKDIRRFPKIAEDYRGRPNMFRWYTNYFKYNLRDKLGISEIIDIFTCEDIISSHVRILYCFYEIVTTQYTTDFYIIIANI